MNKPATDTITFTPLDELIDRAAEIVAEIVDRGWTMQATLDTIASLVTGTPIPTSPTPVEFDITSTHDIDECELCRNSATQAVSMSKGTGSTSVSVTDGQHVARASRKAVAR